MPISPRIHALMIATFGLSLLTSQVARAADAASTSPNGSTSTQQAVPTVSPSGDAAYVGMTSENIGVMDRPRPPYDAKGIPLGGFRLFPTMDLVGTYDDNVFRQSTKSSDWYLAEAPALRLQSQWGRHFVEAYGGLYNYNYANNSRLDLTDWTIGGDGRLDLLQGLTVSGNASYGEMHESLASPNTIGSQVSPNRYYKTDAYTTVRYQPTYLGLEVKAMFDRYDFNDTPLIGGGMLNNSGRNEDEYQAYAKAFYDFSPGYSAFVRASYDSRQFDTFLDLGGVHRDSTGYRINGGLDLQLTHLVSGEIYGGYLVQSFSHSLPAGVTPLSNITGVDFGVALDWYATPVLTVHLKASHDLTDVTIASSSASNDENLRLSADYELFFNTIIKGYFGYTHSEFVGTNRTDEYPSAGISALYMLNNYLSADLGYNYSERSSSLPVTNFNDSVISFSITGHI